MDRQLISNAAHMIGKCFTFLIGRWTLLIIDGPRRPARDRRSMDRYELICREMETGDSLTCGSLFQIIKI